jgi:hypothetical protein
VSVHLLLYDMLLKYYPHSNRQLQKPDQWDDLIIRIFGSPDLDEDYLTEEDSGDDGADPGMKRRGNGGFGEPTAKRARRTK